MKSLLNKQKELPQIQSMNTAINITNNKTIKNKINMNYKTSELK